MSSICSALAPQNALHAPHPTHISAQIPCCTAHFSWLDPTRIPQESSSSSIAFGAPRARCSFEAQFARTSSFKETWQTSKKTLGTPAVSTTRKAKLGAAYAAVAKAHLWLQVLPRKTPLLQTCVLALRTCGGQAEPLEENVTALATQINHISSHATFSERDVLFSK